MTTTSPVHLLASGGHYFEGARWHDGTWWVSDIYAKKVCTYDTEGNRTEIMHVEGNPSGLGWLPDGSLLVVSMHDRTLLRRTADGEVSVYADLSELCAYELNDMVINAAGQVYVGTIGFAIAQGDEIRPGAIYRVDPDGTGHVAAENVICPNGMVITNDDRTLIVAESFSSRLTAFTIGDDGALTDQRAFAQIGADPGLTSLPEMMAASEIWPDGCAIDAEDNIWVADAGHQRIVRIDPHGKIVEEIKEEEGLGIYACALGGDDGRTLLMCSVPDFFAAAQGTDTDKAVLKTTRVAVPHGGRP
ncbi:hypothetical protein BAY61_17880 [Prauserella marina]|uniref:Sugar lactone lactonase YvrE n=1 Tax=Prauserella marina TaxID=530584 RepID=A0A222VRM0_9PSEU|nr:SMP-30/gluconolactonase/LRE family protein [Prauserella marina]ASR36558.1 hypothetical protein BAY61_17880 [Prauserella marina]PWV73962.1 gluconolactonase [Prauserella marina]SDD59870.1 Sugar lactone lactonase YvrE [Prauserella marina]